jgi:dolichol-phosphate mannosyltransferase
MQGAEPNSDRVSALVCIPTYNERENLASLVAEILATATVDVLIVDDASPDGTGAIAQQLADRSNGRVDVVHRPAKLGLGSAYIDAFRVGLARGYDLLIEMDGDGSHQPRFLPDLLHAAASVDVVIGSRAVAGGGIEDWEWWRRLLSAGGSTYARTILHMPTRDLTSGFKCFRREVLEALDLDAVISTGYAFQIELTYLAHTRGFRVGEIPIVFTERHGGRSKMSSRIVLEAIVAVWRMRLRGSQGA